MCKIMVSADEVEGRLFEDSVATGQVSSRNEAEAFVIRGLTDCCMYMATHGGA